jgi:DNA-binding protein YbaB
MVPGDGDGDFDRLLRETRRSLESLRAGPAPSRPEEPANARPVRGTGEAYEGQVRAGASDGRLERLEVEPKLMRLPPEQLAPHLVAAANAALDDLRAKTPATDAGSAVDPAVLAERLGEVTNEGLARMASISQGLTEAIARISREAHVSGDTGDHGLEHLLTQARRTAQAASVPAAADEAADHRGEGTDADGKVRAVAVMGGRIETLHIDPEAMRAASYELGERAVTAVNAALEAVQGQARAASDQEDLAARVKAVQDLSLEHMRAYSQALAGLMGSIERR